MASYYPSPAKLPDLLAIQIILSGVIMIFVVIPLLLAPFLTTLLAPAPPRRTPHRLSGHTIVMGYDEITSSVIDSLAISDHDIVIIEQDKAKALEIATHYRKRAYVIWGDYTDPGTWSAAHIAGAHFVVICMDERQTASIVLGIREQVKGKIISVVDKLSLNAISDMLVRIMCYLPNIPPEGSWHGMLFSTPTVIQNRIFPGWTGFTSISGMLRVRNSG